MIANDILHNMLGVILFVLGIVIMLYACRYGALVMAKETDPNFGIALLGLLGYGLLCWSLLLFGFSIILSLFIITPLIFGGFLYINALTVDTKTSIADKVICTLLFVLIEGCLIFVYWYYTTTNPGIEKKVDESILGTSTDN